MAPPKPTFARGDYLTDGKRLIHVLLVLPDNQVLVEDVGRRGATLGEVAKLHLDVAVLNDWLTMAEWSRAHRVAAA